MEKDTKEDEAVCIFIELLNNCHKRRTIDFRKLSETRLQTVIKASKKRKDNVDIHNNEEIMTHKACLLKYTSSNFISKHLKCKSNGKKQELVPTKCTRRSNASFEFKKICLFCANSCNIEPDSKHPDRWRKNKGILCCTADRGKEKKSVKEVILEVKYFFCFFS